MSAATLDLIRSNVAVGAELLGTMIWWTLADARVGRSTLEQLWASAGLPPEHLPEAPTSEKAIKSAVRECAVGQAERLIRLGKEDAAEVVFAILRESRDDAGNVTATQEARVVLDRTSEQVSTDQPSHDLVMAIRAAFERLRNTHGPDDVRRAMIKTIDACAAVTLRDHGGVYWIPAPYAESVRKLQLAIERIGSSRVYLLPVHKSDDATRTLGDVAKSSVEQELEALKAEVQGFLATPPDRISTLVRRLDSFEALRSKANLYKDILSVHVADLESTLGELTVSVEKLLTQKRAA